jgi:hypothetical protein
VSFFSSHWTSPGVPCVQLSAISPRATPSGDVVVLGYCHGSTQLYPLPGSRSALLKATRIPASTESGKAMRAWLDELLTSPEIPHAPDQPEPGR